MCRRVGHSECTIRLSVCGCMMVVEPAVCHVAPAAVAVCVLHTKIVSAEWHTFRDCGFSFRQVSSKCVVSCFAADVYMTGCVYDEGVVLFVHTSILQTCVCAHHKACEAHTTKNSTQSSQGLLCFVTGVWWDSCSGLGPTSLGEPQGQVSALLKAAVVELRC